MDPTWFIIGILVVFLIGQQVYWSFIVLKLNDRLMSKSFAEFSYGERTRKTVKVKVAQAPSEDTAGTDPIAEENARRANSLLL